MGKAVPLPDTSEVAQKVFLDPTAINGNVSILFIPVGFVNPIIVMFGIVTNIIVIIQMMRPKVKINPSSRLFYLFIGFSDLLYNLSFGLGIQVLMDAVFMWTDNNVLRFMYPGDFQEIFKGNGSKGEKAEETPWVFLDGIVWCKLLGCLTCVSLICSPYGLVAFNIERFIAIYYPLWKLKFNPIKLSIVILICCVLPPVLMVLSLCVVANSSVNGTEWSFTEFRSSCIPDQASPAFILTGTVFGLILTMLQLIINAILAIAIMQKIKASSHLTIRRTRGRSTPRHDAEAESRLRSSISELANSMTLVASSCINFLIYGSVGIFWIIYVVTAVFMEVGSNTGLMAKTIARLLVTFMNIPFSSNFFIYLAVLRPFRRSFTYCRHSLGADSGIANSGIRMTNFPGSQEVPSSRPPQGATRASQSGDILPWLETDL